VCGLVRGCERWRGTSMHYRRRDGLIDSELRRALVWWKEALSLRLAERRPWQCKTAAPLHLFCDARGEPPHLAAVLFDGERRWFTHCEPPSCIMDSFRRRRDNQIMGLELLSISLGLSTFEAQLRDRQTVVYSDNTGSEVPCLWVTWVVLWGGGGVAGLCATWHCQESGPCPTRTRTMAACGKGGHEPSCRPRRYG